MLEIEIWVRVNADGDYRTGEDAGTAAERFRDDVGDDDHSPTRTIRVVLQVPKPCVPTLTGIVPAEGDATLTVA